ncbi:hypothetical protein TNCV_5019371 [Trichonephila clavipes]|nr:hypothetical protein TNCV_5019371 [Trichonephila clavipes]
MSYFEERSVDPTKQGSFREFQRLSVEKAFMCILLKYKFDDDIQKVTPARAPLAFSLLSNSALMSKSFSFDLLRLRAKTAWLWLPQSASLTVRCPQRYVHRDQRRI